ncbi:MAG TPA: hypothetical protein DDZ80_26365 [Cyanobacteria bacterium UBA8803]|nr:hypothetical protein [Cyanobacteria bacterium UBA9273]HBL61808.1 hypothetical protein [Cyanobacteria bacterium UBA8803]
MKIKLLPLLAGIAAMALTAIPMIVKAQPANLPVLPGLQEVISNLNLTEEQQAQFAQIRSETQAKLENVLTAQQKNTLQAAIAQGKPLRQAMASLNLTPEQKTEIRSILQSARQQGRDIVTEEQRQQLRQEMQSRRGQGEFRPRNQQR